MKLSPDTRPLHEQPDWHRFSDNEPDEIPVADEYLEPVISEKSADADFILHEYERKLAQAQDLTTYYQRRIDEINQTEAETETNLHDLATLQFLTRKREQYTLNILQIKKVLDWQAEIDTNQDLRKNQAIMRAIAEFKFPTDVSGKSEILSTQVIVKKSNLENQKRILRKIQAESNQEPTPAYFETVALINELETEISDIEAELERREHEDLPIAEEVEDTNFSTERPQSRLAATVVTHEIPTSFVEHTTHIKPPRAKPLVETQGTPNPPNKQFNTLTRLFKKVTDKFKRAA